MIGVPSAACSANSFRPGAICGACGNRRATSSDRIVLHVGDMAVAELRQRLGRDLARQTFRVSTFMVLFMALDSSV